MKRSPEECQNYLIKIIALIKQQALAAKKVYVEKHRIDDGYESGVLMTFYAVVDLFKEQADVWSLDMNKLGLDDIDPDHDILGLQKKPVVTSNHLSDNSKEASAKRYEEYLIYMFCLLRDMAQTEKEIYQKNACIDDGYFLGKSTTFSSIIDLFKTQAAAIGLDLKKMEKEE